jgi:hypothetical protein
VDSAEYFRLLCSYFSGKCTIYTKKRAMVCSGFKCKLLVNFNKGKIQKVDALKIIENVKKYRKEVEDIAFTKLKIPRGTPFKTLQAQISEIKESNDTEINNHEIDSLIGRCLILEVLLTKYFLSKEDFDKMIINPETEILPEMSNNM